jgi:hypothetical protein
VALLAGACGGAVRNTGETPSASATPSPAHDRWETLTSSEVGVIFDFPKLGGQVKYEFVRRPRARNGCAASCGLAALWEVSGEDGLLFGGIHTDDWSPQRGREPVDIDKWVEKEGRYYVQVRPSNLEEVTNVTRVVGRPDGSRAIVFPPEPLFGYEGPDAPEASGALMAVLNLPPGLTGEFHAITLVFPKTVSRMETVLRVINSVRFSKGTAPEA